MSTLNSEEPKERFSLKKRDFGKGFKWGVSTAAYQIEGGHQADGKGPSIWDIFTSKSGKIYQGQNGNIACDFYNKYEEDLYLMKDLNIHNFRFSISWSRVIPAGVGTPNPEGIDFYNKLIDKCLALGIEPWVTLYHWDLPAVLEQKGGWTNREIITWFKEYVTLCVKRFGNKVKNWMVLNEPLVFVGAGYLLGVHAPGKKGMKNFLPAIHHAALCQAEGARIIKQYSPQARVGTTFSCSFIEPFRPIQKDILAAQRIDALVNRLFIEPALGMGYPVKDLKFLKKLEKYQLPGDKELLQYDFDFIGVQNYTREIIKHSWFVPYIKARNIKAEKRKVPITAMKWEVYPDSIYQILKKFNSYKKVGEIYITENGAAFKDILEDGEIKDKRRTRFLEEYLAAVLKAKKEGVNVNGYFVWSFTDNFEWAEGFRPRFGLVHVDFKTQKRTVKDSGKWYSNFLKSFK
ncbi:GH1 family beta-glucosidase [Salegentibacter flavus]|uniref:Beta-glucosidase n=1 Tax=Salegentibacter flavus TaxID=287099 RepID=A0A1I5D179_9FLAO|nr:GH1 family beta-glucosidase [Salegentibacter flavus]SFN92907.1 beta-glucosidase [Salegentibacter flavus]